MLDFPPRILCSCGAHRSVLLPADCLHAYRAARRGFAMLDDPPQSPCPCGGFPSALPPADPLLAHRAARRKRSRTAPFLAALVARLRLWAARRRQRRRLAELDDYLLADIGLSREEAAAEASKPFWRP